MTWFTGTTFSCVMIMQTLYGLFQTVEDHQGLSFVQIVKQRKPTLHDPEGATMRTTLLKYFTPKKGLYVL